MLPVRPPPAPLFRTWRHLTPPLAARLPALGGAVRRTAARVLRGPAALDLCESPLAVWPGEVVALAGPRTSELLAILQTARARQNGRVATTLIDPGRGATACAAEALALRVGPTRGLLAIVALVPDVPGRRTLAAFRRVVARTAPCRCMWLVDGRFYPE